MIKNFDKWNGMKKKIEDNLRKLLFKEWEIWRCKLWLNIQDESCWKWDEFKRPILILKKLSSKNLIAIPLSTKQKTWTWFSSYNLHWEQFTALLYQIRMVHINRLKSKIWELDKTDFEKIKKRLKNLLNL